MNESYIKRISERIKERVNDYDSNSRFAKVLGIHPAQLSQIIQGKTEHVLSSAKWMSIARRLDVTLKDSDEWKTAKTPVFQYIWNALTVCQQDSLSGLLCDNADIGKTYTAKEYVKRNSNAIYIDCSQSKNKLRLIKAIAREFGINTTGRYSDIYADIVFYINNGIDNPLIILDEAGDLDAMAFLELKALWNATEHACGWYMMGADGLKAKITRNLDRQTIGYTELFSRFGSRYQKVVPYGREDKEEFLKKQIAVIAMANGVTEIQKLYARTGGSLRRAFIEVKKLKRNEKSIKRDAIDK